MSDAEEKAIAQVTDKGAIHHPEVMADIQDHRRRFVRLGLEETRGCRLAERQVECEVAHLRDHAVVLEVLHFALGIRGIHHQGRITGGEALREGFRLGVMKGGGLRQLPGDQGLLA